MDTIHALRSPAWRHGPRLAAAARGGATAPRRLGAGAMGGTRRPYPARPLRCRSLPRLAFGPL